MLLKRICCNIKNGAVRSAVFIELFSPLVFPVIKIGITRDKFLG